MMNTIRKIGYFAIDVDNKPGEAAKILQLLSQTEVSL
jgi:hypothetical protein